MLRRLPAALALGFAAALAPACASKPPAASAVLASPLEDLRGTGKRRGAAADPETLGRWVLAEMYAPGGTAPNAKEARVALGDKAHPGLYANLGRAIWDDDHGVLRSAATGYVAALTAAAGATDDPLTPLAAWYAARNLVALRGPVADLWKKNRAAIEALLARPGAIGWRAVAELVEWRTSEVFDEAESTNASFDDAIVASSGCARGVRLAGPFGQGSSTDRRRAFPAERPGPWPAEWPAHPSRGTPPRVLPVDQRRCHATARHRPGEGVYYAEVFFETKAPRDVLVAVQGALAVWVDDTLVLERDLREWGVWQRFGAAARVGAGRHRVLARIVEPGTGVRVLDLDGKPAPVTTDGDATKPYSIVPPEPLADPNPLARLVRTRTARDPIESALAAALAHAEGVDDVAAVLVDPLVAPADAAPHALEIAAIAARGDPAFPDDLRRKNEKDARARAAAKDPGLWYSRLWLVLDEAETRGLADAVAPLRALVEAFPEVPAVREQLAGVYTKLGWRAERLGTLAELARRFPDAVSALHAYLEALEDDGTVAEADRVAGRIEKLDPDAEVGFARAIARREWTRAVAELRRIEKRRPDRKDIAARVADVLARSGDPGAAVAQLERALAKEPLDADARFRLADRHLARGDAAALRKGLADALQSGAKAAELREAIDLVEGAVDLEPWRMDGLKVIRDFEAWEKTGEHMDGTAARVLDYAAVWVNADGASSMLEHEILKIQSQEAVGSEAEQRPPGGLVLHLRVVKPDGSTLEPEFVAGKPTLTMPHLEVGDYVEIEHISSSPGDGQKGKRFRGPQWFFREADKGYWRSELVALTPKDRPLDVEVRGQVAPPRTRDVGTFVERRWRVDLSPPAPAEPDAPRPQEFLPSVRIGWGISLEELLGRVVDTMVDETPLDPRLKARAEEIVKGLPAERKDERAQRAYRWVLENVQEGRETDGRRAITGKSGSREAAFEHLVRQLGIPVENALVKDRLAAPALGKMSEVETWDAVVLRLATEKGTRWLTVRDKFAPFGWVPPEVRGQPAIRLVAGAPRDTVAQDGAADAVAFEGRADVRDDGSAGVDLVQRYTGRPAIQMRNVLDRVPAGQLRDFVETRILARNLPGARLKDVAIEGKDTLDAPLAIRVKAEVAQILKPQGARGMALKSLFPMRLAQLAALPERQTPLMLGAASHVEVHFQVVAPDGMRMPASLPGGEIRDGERTVKVADAVHGHALELHRVLDVPAGRVQPGAEYQRFQRFAREADAFVEKEILLGR